MGYNGYELFTKWHFLADFRAFLGWFWQPRGGVLGAKFLLFWLILQEAIHKLAKWKD